MKNIFLFILFGTFMAFGQNGGSNTEQDKSYIPNITPPTPESYNMTKYGDIAVNEFYGKSTISLPIYSYKSGQLSVSFTLNHDGCGVKVDDISNWTGSNWSLDTGGIITRTINDLTDETANTRKFIPVLNDFVTQYNTADGTTGATQLANFITDGVTDTEVDIFNYSIPGYSGSFYLDQNFNPVLTKLENEIKIEAVGNFIQTKEFIIITPDGIKYYFGGVNATEQTSIRLNPYGSGITSFFLTKIQHPISGNIFYEYNNLIGSKLNLSLQQALTFFSKKVIPDMSAEGFTSMAYVEAACPQSSGIQTNVVTTTTNQLTLINHKYLYRIYSDLNNEEVIFNSERFENNFNIDRVLNSIEVKVSNTLVHKVNFNYFQQIKLGELQRIFLTSVQIDKDLQVSNLSSKKYEEYKFKYNSYNDLPARLSFSQDFLGYYNGKTNPSLLPNSVPTNEELLVGNITQYDAMLSDSRLGDRTPDFNFATKGILTDIYYPTGGFTHFEYEPEPAKRKKYITYSSEMNGNNIPGYNSNGDYVSFSPVYETQVGKIYFSLISDDFAANHFCQASIKITDLTDSNINPQTFTKSLGYVSTTGIYDYTFIKDHVYQIELINSTNSNCNLEMNFWLTLFDGYERVDNIGIRLKKQMDYTSETDSIPNVKRYYYSSPSQINIPVEELPYVKVPNYFYDQMVNKLFDTTACAQEFGAAGLFFGVYETQYYYKILTSNSYNNYFTGYNNSQVYPEVTISYGGDNFEKGGVFKIFSESPNYSPAYLFPITERRYSIGQASNDFDSRRTNHNIVAGDLIKEITFKKENNTLYKLVQKDYVFNTNIVNSVSNLVGKEVYSFAINTAPFNTTVSNFFMGLYDIKTFKKETVSNTTKEFFELVPLNSTDDSSFKKITTTQNFEYGTLRGLPTVVTTNTSDSAVVNKAVNTYVNTASSLASIPSNQVALYTSLISQNRVASPVQTQQFKNTELLSTQRTLYNNFTVNSVTKILPEKIQIGISDLTANPLEDKAIFYNYDEHFNPVVMGYKDAPKTRYLFNTDGLVAAKIENYTGTATTFPLITGNIDNTLCALQTQYPDAIVTVFQYNLITKKIIQTIDANCRNTFYEYDDLQRLKLIKDHDGNIVKEFDQQFKPQN